MSCDDLMSNIKKHLFTDESLASSADPILAHMQTKKCNNKDTLIMSFTDGNGRFIGAAVDLSTQNICFVTPETEEAVLTSSCMQECMQNCGHCPTTNPPARWACLAGCNSGCP